MHTTKFILSKSINMKKQIERISSQMDGIISINFEFDFTLTYVYVKENIYISYICNNHHIYFANIWHRLYNIWEKTTEPTKERIKN